MLKNAGWSDKHPCCAGSTDFVCFLFYKLIKVALKDQLPGGLDLFYVTSPELSAETLVSYTSQQASRKCILGCLIMVRFRPNATTLTNESFITFLFNKTHERLDSLPNEEIGKLLTASRKQGRTWRGDLSWGFRK